MSFRTKRKIFLVIVIMVTLLVSINPKVLHACPGCSAALNADIGRGFNLSILYMLAMPFVVFGGVALGIIYVTRQNRIKSRQFETSTVKNKEKKIESSYSGN